MEIRGVAIHGIRLRVAADPGHDCQPCFSMRGKPRKIAGMKSRTASLEAPGSKAAIEHWLWVDDSLPLVAKSAEVAR